MTKRLLAITISILLIISILPVIVLGTSVTLELSQDRATVGTSITTSGIADPNEWVSIKVVDSSGSVVFYDAVKSDADGNYSCTFIVPQVAPGALTVVAGYSSNVANKALLISKGGSVTLSLSQENAVVGDSITASGGSDPNELVSIKVVDSSESVVFYEAVKSDADGNYSCTFIVPQVAPGTLTVVAGYGSNVANKALTIGSGGGDTVWVTGVSLNKNSTIIVQGSDETLVAVVAPANASDKDVIWSSNNTAVATVDENGKVIGISPGTATITVITVDGNKMAGCNVTVTEPKTVPSGGTVIIEKTPVTITVEQGETGSITVTQDKPLPLVDFNSGTVDMTIPQGTEVSGSETIQLPEVIDNLSVERPPNAREVDLVIKVGGDSGTIEFSKPVRLVFKGQGQKSAGFIDNDGIFHPISKLESLKGLISDSDADAVKAVLGETGAGAVVSGNDLIIWTTHFTKFIAYTPKPVDECFIATAAFGSKFEPAVVLLRAFRDTFLLTNAPGTAFVDFYYQNSPPIASYIANSGFLKAGVRALLTPVVGVVYLLFHPVLMYGIIGLLVFGIVIYRIRKRRVPSF